MWALIAGWLMPSTVCAPRKPPCSATAQKVLRLRRVKSLIRIRLGGRLHQQMLM